ncbi:hypothetical protein [Legionella fallonii]|uniref:Uncharacterized protein n=1 Tax=Legionella fallonii LLAP-10 TaxID=1212491 RepID=A0A098G8W6_9GAMM|nr:hypothetical protein [Legionella fallonii]CEG58439.1 protein of unknown function [Legionella fallonii LLAP-10]
MPKLNKILQTIDDEFEKEKEKRLFGISVKATDTRQLQIAKLQELPHKKQAEICAQFAILYNEYQNFPSTRDKQTYKKLLGTLEWIINTQGTFLYVTMKSYEEHLEKTKPVHKEDDAYKIWDEKRGLMEKAISTLLKYQEDVRKECDETGEAFNNLIAMEKSFANGKKALESKYIQMYSSKMELLKQAHNQNVPKEADDELMKQLDTLFFEEYNERFLARELELTDLRLSIEDRKKNQDKFALETLLTAIQNTLLLFTSKPNSDDSRTGLEILEQDKDGWFAKLIIDFVNFFRTIGAQSPEHAEAIRRDTQWQFWKQPRHQVLSAVNQSVLHKSEQSTVQDDSISLNLSR